MASERTKKGFVVFMSVLTALVIFALGFGFGNRNFALRDGKVPALVSTELGKPADVDFSLFWDVFRQIEQDYVEDDVSKQALTYGAIRGLVAALDDPYSLFLTPDEQRDFFASLNGRFDGIGAEVGERDGGFVIIAPLDDSPAKLAGIQPGDQIVTIDGDGVESLTLTEAVTKIRGPKGTAVVLGILSKGADAPRDVSITRDTIQVSSVKSELGDDSIGLIRIRQFGDDTADQVRQAAEGFVKQGAQGIVLDLRSNPGGYLEGAVDVASLWIEDGPIVFEQYRSGKRDTYSAAGTAILKDLPTAVLVDNGSASASEIVAGALQDTKQGRLFGVTTFGKGSVQDIKELKDDSALRLTIAKWLTPTGRSINHEGIEPDELVETADESGTSESAKSDATLERALSWIKDQIEE